MSNLVTGAVLSVVGVVFFVFSGIPVAFFAEPVLASLSVWEILDVLANILAPLIGALIAIIVWLHRRITRLEEAQTQHEASLYGLNNDQLARGVTDEITQLREEFTEFKENFEDRMEDLEDD